MEERLLQLLIEAHASRQKPISRGYLAFSLGVDDRTVRQIIYRLRRAGNRICSSTKESGYWIAKDQADYEEFRKTYITAPMRVFEAVRAMDECLPGQIKMSEFDAGEQMKTDNEIISRKDGGING